MLHLYHVTIAKPEGLLGGGSGHNNCATQKGAVKMLSIGKVQASRSFTCSCSSGWPAFRRRARREDN